MKNITLSIDEELLKQGRLYAKGHGMSLNKLVRRLLRQTVTLERKDWAAECFKVMDDANGHSGGKTWCREDLYDV